MARQNEGWTSAQGSQHKPGWSQAHEKQTKPHTVHLLQENPQQGLKVEVCTPK